MKLFTGQALHALKSPDVTLPYQPLYEALNIWMDSKPDFHLPVSFVDGDSEPLATVQEFIDAQRRTGFIVMWSQHLHDHHDHFSNWDYARFRVLHDIHGHQRTFEMSKGAKGEFNIWGECQAVLTVAAWDAPKAPKPVDLIEAHIVETVTRNLIMESVRTTHSRRLAQEVWLTVQQGGLFPNAVNYWERGLNAPLFKGAK
jgi:hypothetical protein